MLPDKKYGLKTIFIWFLFWALVFTVFSSAVTHSLGFLVVVFILVIIGSLQFFSIIYVNNETIIIKPLVRFFDRKYSIKISDIDKLEIIPSYFYGNTSYVFHLKDNKKTETFNKLLWFERNAFAKQLKHSGISVIMGGSLHI